jgi:L-fuculose-phosphate aldolase
VSTLSEKHALVDAARALGASGLTPGTSGNVSRRTHKGMLVTPTGVAYEDIRAEDLVEVELSGQWSRFGAEPSSEWRIHRDIYRARPEAGAVVHAHSMFCTTLSALRSELPAVHYMIAVTGAPRVRCAQYATFGTEELSRNVLAALEGSLACLMANHGMVALGPSLKAALKVAKEVEVLAEQYWRALQVGRPHILDDQEVSKVAEKFKTYGQPRKARERA